MGQRLAAALVAAVAAAVLGEACGAVSAPQAGASPTGPAVITLIVRPGADGMAVGRRVGGPGAEVSLAYPDRRPRENLPQAVLLRTFVVTVPAGQEQDVLRRARADPDVELAYVGPSPGP